jgi:hypothetical protein
MRSILLLAAAWLLIPEPLWAWGPGTHIALGELVLGSLYLLPPGVRALLERYPIHFLYGSVAADISFAKKYVPEGRHCHHWHVGEEILEMAGTEPLEAMGLGYLAHLAADTVAHNLYVPRQLLLTATTASVGHTYWEHRMDVHVGEDYLTKARHIVFENDHSEADALFDEVLSSTIFSFRTNRQLFRGLIQVQGDDRWLQLFDRILKKSRYDVPDEMVQRYLALSYDSIVDYLRNRHTSTPAGLDPIGDLNLRLAKKVRRVALADGASGDPGILHDMADEFFPFPDAPLVFWPKMKSEELMTDPGPAEEASPDDAGHAPPLPVHGPDD